MTEYLTTEDVLRLHRAAHGCADDLGCIADLGLIESAVARPQASLFGADAYPDLWLKAAALLHSLTANQGFVDGNERTAWQCAWTFLAINGQMLSADYDPDETEQFMLGVDNHAKLDGIADTLRTFSESGGTT